MRLERRLFGKPVVAADSFVLDDKMEAQTFSFRNSAKCSQLYLYLDELFTGSKWQDIVISEIQFIGPNGAYTPKLSDQGINVFGSYYHEYNYIKENLTYERFQYGKAGDQEISYLYDYSGRVSLSLDLEMDDITYVNYFYKSESDRAPFQKDFYGPDGKLIKRILLDYSNGKLVSERSVIGDPETIKYRYLDGQLFETARHKGGSSPFDSKKTFTYVGDRIDSEQVKEANSTSVWQYVYSEGVLRTKFPIFATNWGTGPDGLPAYPGPIYYTYKSGKLLEEVSSDYKGDWEQR